MAGTAATSRLRGVRVLGPVRAVLDSGEDVALPRLERALLALLALNPDRHVSMAAIVDGLWGDAAPATATNTVQTHVHNMRRALGKDVIVTVAGGYRLELSPDDVDAGRFSQLVAEGGARLEQGDLDGAVALLVEGLGLWRGNALADCLDAPFAELEATRLEGVRLTAEEDRFLARAALGEGPALVPELETLVARHPYRERLRVALMTALYRSGRRADALDQYATARELFVDELGLEPGPQMQELQAAILAEDPVLAPSRALTDRSALDVEAVRMAEPPVPTSSIIGRDQDVAAVLRLVASPSARLVTLLGPGGVGKTRLAVAVARSAATVRDGRVAWAPLAALRDVDEVLPAVAQAVGARGIEPTPSNLASWLGSAGCLLVMDNLEQVLPSAAAVVAELLATIPSLTVLATSRVALRIAGEHRQVLAPLAGPSPQQLADSDMGGIAAAPAVALFLDRALAVAPELSRDDASIATVARLCARLDGLPLALELAAARITILSPQALLDRLDPRLSLIASTSLDSEDRHRSLRATLEWSVDLLSDRARTLLTRLAVFRGSFSADAAEAVGVPALGDGSGLLVLDVLGELADASLLVTAVDQLTSQVRFSLLDSVRELALELLRDEPGGEAAARAAHATFYAELLRGLWPVVPLNPRTVTEAHLLALEQFNLAAAAEHTAVAGPAAEFADLAVLGASWFGQNELGQAWVPWLERVVDDPSAGVRQVDATLLMSRFRSDAGQEGVADLLAAAASLAAEHQDEPRRAWVGSHRAFQCVVWGQEDLALDHAEDALRRLAVGGPELVAVAAVVTSNCAVAFWRADPDRCRQLLMASRQQARLAGDEYGRAVSTTNLAELAAACGQAQEALAFILEARAAFAALGMLRPLGVCLAQAGFTHLLLDDVDAARRAFAEAAAMCLRTDNLVSLADSAIGMAEVAAALHRPAESALLLAVHEELYARIGQTQTGTAAVVHERVRERTNSRAVADATALAVSLTAADVAAMVGDLEVVEVAVRTGARAAGP